MVKMDVVPRLIYMFQTIPIILPRQFFKTLRTAILKLIWGNKKARIRRETLVKPKEKGGTETLDIAQYQVASLLLMLHDWFHKRDSKFWIQLEKQLSPVDIQVLPRVILRQVWPYFDGLCQKLGLIRRWGPMTPIFNNPEFRPGYHVKNFLCWDSRERTRVRDLVTQTGIPTFNQLQNMQPTKRLSWLGWLQLNAFIQAWDLCNLVGKPLS